MTRGIDIRREPVGSSRHGFATVHSSIQNRLGQGRSLSRRGIHQVDRTAALAAWLELGAVTSTLPRAGCDRFVVVRHLPRVAPEAVRLQRSAPVG